MINTYSSNLVAGPDVFERRKRDWRNSQVVYQVFVDRFAIGGDLASRSHLYSAPRRLRPWRAQPRRGTFDPGAGVWRQELDFWGGDLKGVASRLDYIARLGANVVYLNPIFEAFTNHKYDTVDYFAIDPQFGTEGDLAALCEAAHARGLKVVLDGVFNHTGRRCAWFEDASARPESPYRSYYRFDSQVSGGCVTWRNSTNLPELDLEHEAVREILFEGPDSVVRHHLRWIDGWRLDVASDIGPGILAELTAAAHEARLDSLVIGELWNYPGGWMPAVDAAMNLYLATILMDFARGEMSPPKAAALIAAMVADVGIEPLLKSWCVLSNHDRPRLASLFPRLADRVFLWSLMITLPGSPLVYYGEEIGLEGQGDPYQRGPMDWDRALGGKAEETRVLKELLQLRADHEALVVGDYVPMVADRLLAFSRRTHSARQTVIVAANAGDTEVREAVSPQMPWLVDSTPMRELRTGAVRKMECGFLRLAVPPRTVQIWAPEPEAGRGYRFLKRVP